MGGMPPLVAGQGPSSGAVPSPRFPSTPATGGRGVGAGSVPPIRFNAHTPLYAHLCHLTPCPPGQGIAFGGRTWRTAAHLFEAFKFMAHRPDLAERMRRAGVGRGRSGEAEVDWAELGALLEELEAYVRPDWEDVVLEKVRSPRLFFVSLRPLSD